MTNNPIELRKQAVRRYSRNTVAYIGGGIGGGLLLTILLTNYTWIILGLIIAVADPVAPVEVQQHQCQTDQQEQQGVEELIHQLPEVIQAACWDWLSC